MTLGVFVFERGIYIKFSHTLIPWKSTMYRPWKHVEKSWNYRSLPSPKGANPGITGIHYICIYRGGGVIMGGSNNDLVS